MVAVSSPRTWRDSMHSSGDCGGSLGIAGVPSESHRPSHVRRADRRGWRSFAGASRVDATSNPGGNGNATPAGSANAKRRSGRFLRPGRGRPSRSRTRHPCRGRPSSQHPHRGPHRSPPPPDAAGLRALSTISWTQTGSTRGACSWAPSSVCRSAWSSRCCCWRSSSPTAHRCRPCNTVAERDVASP